jgi:hypothetical protein
MGGENQMTDVRELLLYKYIEYYFSMNGSTNKVVTIDPCYIASIKANDRRVKYLKTRSL